MTKRIKWNMQRMYVYCKEHSLDFPVDNQEYTSMKAFYTYICSKHDILYKQRWQNHIKGELGCPQCQMLSSKVKRKKTIEFYFEECLQKGVDTPLLNQKYVTNDTKIKHKCSRGHIYEQRPSSNLRGVGCPKCRKLNYNHYYMEWNSLHLDLPVHKKTIENSNDTLIFKCKQGHQYKQAVNQHKYYGCPICNESHGERFIRNYLDKNNIKYEAQKKFHNLKDKTYLSYDFYLPEYNTLIEYQGIQHYEECNYFGGKDRFKEQQLHDKMKKEYAKENGYRLLEIKYTLNTQELVDKYLSRRIK